MSTDQLFRHYAPFVSRFLLRLGVGEDAVDDALQEVFLVAHRSGGYQPGPAKPTTYLATIAVHAAAAHRRAQKTRAARSSADDLDGLAAPERDPAEALEARDSLRQLQSALDRLDDNLRATLLMADGIGQTCPTIAAAMNVPLGTVYWRLDRARKLFRVAWRSVGAGQAPHRKPDNDASTLRSRAEEPRASTKRERRGRKAGAWVVWLQGSVTNTDARAWLRTSCEPSAAELASACTAPLPRGLTASGAPQPAWASAIHPAPHASAWLGLGALKLASLGTVGAAAIAVCTYLGAHPSTPVTPTHGLPASGSRQDSAQHAALAPTGAASSRTEAHTREPHAVPSDPRSPAEPARASTPTSSASEATLTSAAPLAQTHSRRPALTRAVERASATATRHGDVEKAGLGRSSASSPARRVQPRAQQTKDAASAATQAQLLEAREVARAERMLATDPHEALRLVRTLGSRVGSDGLREERDYIEVMALFRIGRAQDARAASTHFLRTYPESAFAGAIVSTARRLSTDS